VLGGGRITIRWGVALGPRREAKEGWREIWRGRSREVRVVEVLRSEGAE
jgi:hypothetical protein